MTQQRRVPTAAQSARRRDGPVVSVPNAAGTAAMCVCVWCHCQRRFPVLHYLRVGSVRVEGGLARPDGVFPRAVRHARARARADRDVRSRMTSATSPRVHLLHGRFCFFFGSLPRCVKDGDACTPLFEFGAFYFPVHYFM